MNERSRKVFEQSFTYWWHNKLVLIGSQPRINRTLSPAKSVQYCNTIYM